MILAPSGARGRGGSAPGSRQQPFCVDYSDDDDPSWTADSDSPPYKFRRSRLLHESGAGVSRREIQGQPVLSTVCRTFHQQVEEEGWILNQQYVSPRNVKSRASCHPRSYPFTHGLRRSDRYIDSSPCAIVLGSQLQLRLVFITPLSVVSLAAGVYDSLSRVH